MWRKSALRRQNVNRGENFIHRCETLLYLTLGTSSTMVTNIPQQEQHVTKEHLLLYM